MQFHRPGQCHGFGIPANSHQRIRVEGVIYRLNRLLDNRTFIQVRGDIVSRRTDELNPAGVSLVVRLGTFKAGQE